MFVQELFATLFPHHCYLCSSEIIEKSVICKRCRETITLPQINLLKRPKQIQSHTGDIYSFWDYVSPMPDLFHLVKFKSKKKLLNYLLSKIGLSHMKDLNGDAITYIPLHYSQYQERDFNQSKIIAKYIGDKLNIPVLGILKKKRTIIKQSHKTKVERLKVLDENEFKIKKKHKVLIKDKRIIIIDDIITTGATLASAAREIQSCGAKTSCVTLFHSELE